MKYNMDKYGTNITNEIISNKLSKDIIELVDTKKDEIIELDFALVKLVTTFSVKSIFKPIAEKYGVDNIFTHIQPINVNKDLQVIIKQGLNSLLD